MADAIYICSISGGKCIENTQQAKGECRLRKWNKSAAQQWIVEQDEKDPNIVAFKSVADQQYLAALQPDKRNGGKIGVQKEKQWFTLEPGIGPGWFNVKCNSSFGGGKAGYLNDEWGRMKDDNKIQTYQYEANNPGFNTFYFPGAEAVGAQKLNLSTGSSSAGDDQNADLEAREKELRERENGLQERERKTSEESKQIEQRAAKLTEREEELARREKNEESEKDSAQKASDERERLLEERENAVKKREADIEKEEKQSGSGQATGEGGRQTENDQADALQEREDAVSKREAAVEDREKKSASAQASNSGQDPSGSADVEQQAASTTQPSSSGSVGDSDGAADVHELCRLLRENDALKAKVKTGELEAQIRDLRERVCQHKVKRPPRKIDHRVAGYVYA